MGMALYGNMTLIHDHAGQRRAPGGGTAIPVRAGHDRPDGVAR